MKKHLFISSILICFLTNELSAQQKDSVVVLPTVTVTSTSIVTKEVDKSFKKSFPNAENLKWYKLNKNYLAKFIQNDMKHNTLIAENGNIKYDISYGTESNLPEDLLVRIKGGYSEYNITRVANIKESNRNIWVINLESLKHIVLVRIEEDEMEEVERLNKS